jgi:hypothetical protein
MLHERAAPPQPSPQGGGSRKALLFAAYLPFAEGERVFIQQLCCGRMLRFVNTAAGDRRVRFRSISP